MVGALIGYGAKKLAKKVAKKAAPKTAKGAARAAAASRGLSKMDAQNRSAVTVAQEIRAGANKMQRKADRVTAQSDRRLLGAGAAGVGAVGATIAYEDRKKKKTRGGAMKNVQKARDRSAEELRKMGE